MTAVFAASCAPIVNDWSKRKTAPEASYQITLPAGSSAGDLLSSKNFKKLVVEIQSVRGFAPAQETINRLQKFLEARLDKPGGITIVTGTELPTGLAGTLPDTTSTARGASRPAGHTVASIREIQSGHRRQRPIKDELTVYVLFLDGASADDRGDAQFLGQAFGNTSIVVYAQTLRERLAAQSAATPLWLAELTIVEHEFGHLFGLVHAPITQQQEHEDPLHPGHCKHAKCLMSYTVDTSALLHGLPQDGAVAGFEDDCLADLRTAGGK